MTLQEVDTMLKSITGYEKKVAYYAFPEGKAPALPFICYFVENSDNFSADNIVYSQKLKIAVELYSKNKSLTDEGLIEAAFLNNGLFWNKEETFLDDERCFEVIYNIEV